MAFPKLCLVITAMLAGCAIGAEEHSPQPASSSSSARLVYEIRDVTVLVLESYPEQLSITARGTTRSGGWTHPALRPRGRAKDGVYEFDFIAQPPEGIATEAITPIAATTTMKKPADFHAVRVFAETNNKTAK